MDGTVVKPDSVETKKSINDEAPEKVQGVSDDDILTEARKRFGLCQAHDGDNRSNFKTQLNFIAGEQWDQRLKSMRESQNRPCLTFDRLTTCVNQVVNDFRKNKPAIKCHPVDSAADVKTAEVFDGLIRHIERVSNADLAYETAFFTQVAAGFGFWRILTKYHDDTGFEQELVIHRIEDPLTVWLDPHSTQPDGSDMTYCFIAVDIPKEQFERDYPDVDSTGWAGLDMGGWWSAESVRIAEYMRIEKKKTILYALDDGTSTNKEAYDKKVEEGVAVPKIVKKRPGYRREVQWFKIAGDSVVDSRVLNGRWIPLVKVVGNEIVQDGKIKYTGMTWRAMDAQRALNYWKSVVTETIAMQPKAPYIGAKGQFKGVAGAWQNSNINNPMFLEYEPVTIDGNLAPAPQRQNPPTVPTGALEAVRMAEDDIRWVTGMQEATFGAPSNEKSGRAIDARVHQSDTSTYHYQDNGSRSIRHTGRILVDVIPDVYDTPRTLRILGEDGTVDYKENDPEQPKAHVQVQHDDGSVESIYNLGVGKYDVEVAVGPSFDTRRLESLDAMGALIQASPQLWQVIGDLYVRNQDWPGAQAMADRLAKTIPPQIKGDENDPGSPEQKLAQLGQQADQMHQALTEIVPKYQETMQQNQQMQQAMEKLQSDLDSAKESADLETYKAEAKSAIDAYSAETARLAAVSVGMTPEQIAALVQQTLNDMMQTPPLTEQLYAFDQEYVPAQEPAQAPEMAPEMPPQ